MPLRKKKLPLPVVDAAIGMALSYYLYPVFAAAPYGYFLLAGLLLLLMAAICFFRVMRFPIIWGKIGKTPPAVIKVALLAASAAVGFSLGIASRRAVSGPAAFGIEAGKLASVSGILVEDPRTLQGGSGLGTLELRECGSSDGLRAGARGRLALFFPPESIMSLKEFGRGCLIFSEGRLRLSGAGPVFTAVSVHVTKPAPPIEQFRTRLRLTLLGAFRDRQGRFTRSFEGGPRWGALASALLLGVRDDLDVDLSAGFRNSGCSHILALSGMHLAIISAILAFLLRRPLGIRWASLVGALFILFYVFVAGSQPSLVRAAIMYILGTIAIWGFLNTEPLPLLCLAFILQILFQPETGVSVSFILSYLALFGILTLGTSLHSIFRGRLPEILSGGISASLGAFLATAPVVALYFGSLKPIGIIAGLLLAPVSSLFMILALAALFFGFFPLPFWDILDFALFWLYRFIDLLVSLAGRVPGLNAAGPVPVLILSLVMWAGVISLQRLDFRKRSEIASFD